MHVGDKIKQARLAKNMTQEELGKRIGVQRSAIAKYEKGRVVNIKRSMLKKISEILDIRPSELIYDESLETVKKDNDAISDIVIKLRTDKEFLNVVKSLYKANDTQMDVVNQFLTALFK